MSVKEEDYIIVSCPYCTEFIMIKKNEFNCKIFRHGTYKSNHNQIDPHLSKELCDKLVKDDLIYGCGKSFQLTEKNDTKICDYI